MSKAHNTTAWKYTAKARRAQAAADNEQPCALCRGHLDYTAPYWIKKPNGKRGVNPAYVTIDHTTPLSRGGEVAPPPDQLRPAHDRCQRRQGQKISAQNRKGKPQPIRPAKKESGVPIFLTTPPRTPTDNSAISPLKSNSGIGCWWMDVPWLADEMAGIPDDARMPRLFTGLRPDAVGSYGLEVIEWARADLKVNLRWWQRVAMLRQLEHDADGRLVWSTVIESTPRRAGKSVRLRVAALWRAHQAPRFGEEQLVLFTGKDLSICKEIHRKAWPWVMSQPGYTVRQVNGQEEISLPDGSRWMVRGRDGVYGYDVTLGMVDEGWGVPSRAVDDGLEPAMLERVSPQLHLTSTAHRKASGLMRTRIAGAEAQLSTPSDTLLMLWGATHEDPVDDPAVWRDASPYWAPERLAKLESVWKRVQEGVAVIDPDEPDPVEAFRSQYLNVWPVAQQESAPELAGWDGLPAAGPRPAAGCVVAVDESRDRSRLVMVVYDSGRAWYSESGLLSELVPRLNAAQMVVAGVGLVPVLEANGVTQRVLRYGSRETSIASGLLAQAVQQGRLSHDHDPRLSAVVDRVVFEDSEHGRRISGRKSPLDPVGLKLIAWCLHAQRSGVVAPRPMIW